MALDVSPESLNRRIDALRNGWAGHNNTVRTRMRSYLRAFSPEFSTALLEHDQWPEIIRQENADRVRSSFNLTRAVVELWTALEASEFPAVRWADRFIPTPPPVADEMEAIRRQAVYQAEKRLSKNISTMREQALLSHIRRAKAPRRFYQAALRKNTFGHSWLKTWPDRDRRTFRISTRIDPSTVFPVWSYGDDDDGRLDAILVAYRRSAQAVNAQFPGHLQMESNGFTVQESGYYTPTAEQVTDRDRAYVWVEDFWLLDDEWDSSQEPASDGEPIRSRVVNLVRINGRDVVRDGETALYTVYNGWRSIPYVYFENENLRDDLGFSDVATMLPVQDSLNRVISQQADVIAGESKPKFKFRGESDRQVTVAGGEIVYLDPDEDIDQIQVSLDVFPTDRHVAHLLEVMSRSTGLPDTVWGRIVAAQNSGRALATAWRAVAARLAPRRMGNEAAIDRWLTMWIDWMELYDWNSARDLYQGSREYELDFPNQEPRDFTEVTLDAINALNAGLVPARKAMEMRGDNSPDETLEEVRQDYLDPVLHPEKRQTSLLIERLEQQMEIEGQQAALMLQQLAAQPAVDQQASAADQARTQAAQQAAPALGEGQQGQAPAAAPGAAANPAQQTQVGTLVQDGAPAQNRIIQKANL